MDTLYIFTSELNDALFINVADPFTERLNVDKLLHDILFKYESPFIETLLLNVAYPFTDKLLVDTLFVDTLIEDKLLNTAFCITVTLVKFTSFKKDAC